MVLLKKNKHGFDKKKNKHGFDKKKLIMILIKITKLLAVFTKKLSSIRDIEIYA